MSKPPLITIGITAYNAESTIEKALKSALSQDWPNFEIVVVDDCSSDDTSAIVRKLAEERSQIRYFRQPQNGGVAAARNRIIKEAKGDFIAFFDDDDESAPDRLQKQYERITNYENTYAKGAPVICHTARKQIYPDGSTRTEPTMGTNAGEQAPHGEEMAKKIIFNAPVRGPRGSLATCSQMARTSLYRDLKGFDANFRRAEDTELNLRVALKGGHFAGMAESLVTQTMTLAADKPLADERKYNLMMYVKHADYLNEKCRGSFDIKWIEAKHDFLEGRKKSFIKKMAGLLLRHPALFSTRIFRAFPGLRYNVIFSRFHKSE